MNIGFYINARVGDSTIALPAFRAIKMAFPSCKFYIFTNSIGYNLYSSIPWIDEVLLFENIEQISNYFLDYLISSNCDKKTITNFKKSNAKKIITYRKFYNLFDPRIRTTFISYRLKPQSQKKNLIDLVNTIFPTKIALEEVDNFQLCTLAHHKKRVDGFLIDIHQKLPKVLVNPFGSAARENLVLSEYEQIIKTLVDKNLIILPTFDSKLQEIQKSFSQDLLAHPNFFIFENDGDLLNLVELVSRMDLLISLSTGVIHIADNLGIPSIALFSHKDTIAWGGEKMSYVILDQVSKEEAINQTLKLTQTLLSDIRTHLENNKC